MYLTERRPATSYAVVVANIILATLLPSPLHCFNIDTTNVKVIQGPKGTLFGFSAKFQPQNGSTDSLRGGWDGIEGMLEVPGSDDRPVDAGDETIEIQTFCFTSASFTRVSLLHISNLVIGAPQANTAIGGPGSGVIHMCSDVLNSDKCIPIFLNDNTQMINGTYNEEFGASVTITDSGKYMACSPRWQDTNHVRSHYTFMPGRCVIADLAGGVDKYLKPFYHTGSDVRNYVIKFGDKQEYYHGLASYGFAVDSDGKSVYVTSAPGVLMFEGKILIRDESTGELNETASIKEDKLDTTAYGYLGYSVKLGKFCDGNDICLAAGAPNLNRVGMIKLFRWRNNRGVLENVQFIEGDQAWSHFGSALAVGDLNNDGYDELLVGAPHFTDVRDALNGNDQGRVFVFSRTAQNSDMKMQVVLEGTRQKFARFGAALQNIGDVNLDSFADVAVGAPGEDNGAGAVYVYVGGLSGVDNAPSQRITAAQVSVGLSSTIAGFGFAFSDYKIPHSNDYPVFAATSVVSDSVVLFKCRPIVDVTTDIKADPNPVDIETTCSLPGIQRSCFVITFCLDFTLRGETKRPLNFNISLDIDRQVRSSNLKRALFRLDDGQLVESIPESKQRVLAKGTCFNYTGVLRENQVNQDRFTPVQIVATYTLNDDKPPGMDPVLDAVKPNNASLMVTFVNKCGTDNICEVDLSIVGDVNYTPTGFWSAIVVNYTKELVVNIAVKNSHETAYWTVIRVDVDSPIPFSRFKSDVPVSCQAVAPATVDPDSTSGTAVDSRTMDKTTVICNYYKPLDKDDSISLTIAFDTEGIALTKDKLSISAQTGPKNEKYNPEMASRDNTASLSSKVQIIANLTVHSSSSPLEVTLYEAKRITLTSANEDPKLIRSGKGVKPLNVTHKILVRNNGPSFLPPTKVLISVPWFLRDGTQLIQDANVTIAVGGEKQSRCIPTIIFDYYGQTETTTASSSRQTTKTTASRTSGESSAGSSQTTTTLPTTTTEESWLPVGPINRRKRAADASSDDSGKGLDTIYKLNCEHGSKICQVYQCDVDKSIPSNSHAEISVSMLIDKASIPIPKEFNTCHFITNAEIKEPSHPLFKSWDKPQIIETVTKFHLVESGGKINIWIIIGSVIAGLVLITFIVIVLWKLGFFKRDKHHQVERFKRESMRRSTKGYSKAPKADPNEGGAAAAAASTPDADL